LAVSDAVKVIANASLLLTHNSLLHIVFDLHELRRGSLSGVLYQFIDRKDALRKLRMRLGLSGSQRRVH
jgi:hypothetical protein